MKTLRLKRQRENLALCSIRQDFCHENEIRLVPVPPEIAVVEQRRCSRNALFCSKRIGSYFICCECCRCLSTRICWGNKLSSRIAC